MTITQPGLFDAPPDVTAPVAGAVRHSDPVTSYLAATRQSNRIRWGTQRAQLLGAYRANGAMTDEQAATAIRKTHEQATRRISELIRDGLVEDTGGMGHTRGGNPCRICRITTAGRDAFKAVRR